MFQLQYSNGFSPQDNHESEEITYSMPGKTVA